MKRDFSLVRSYLIKSGNALKCENCHGIMQSGKMSDFSHYGKLEGLARTIFETTSALINSIVVLLLACEQAPGSVGFRAR